ncbi:hypothetical protein [Methylomonas sp. CM2]|uniref:hypothetical protein n=1 Tax=Methylomonas sp. CM2 TaxID=3417647 RepID=UPI003CE88B1D
MAIGLGTVTKDGRVIKSNDGVGVIKAGWHCGSQPGGSGCTHNCGECQSCDASCTCYWDNSKKPTSLTDSKGDCKKLVCDNGSKQIPDDSDKPTEKCKFCEKGTGNVIDVSSTTDPGGLAALNYLPVKMDLSPKGWGVTEEDDAIFDVTAYCAGVDWKVRITKADQQVHQGVRLLPGVAGVTSAIIQSTSSCLVLNAMKTSLNDVADQNADSGYYVLSAVQAHEDLHIIQYRNDLNPAYTKLKNSIEALSIPLTDAKNAAEAKVKIQALASYSNAMTIFHTDDVAANNATAAHNPMQPFIDIEHGVVDPVIAKINTRRTALGCP